MKIVVFGLGYVGLSNAILLARHHEVVAVDVVEEKVNLVNNKISPISDDEISHYLSTIPLNLHATMNGLEHCNGADLVIVATPTNYDEKTHYFDTSLVEIVLEQVRKVNQNVPIVIKSTIPVGYIDSLHSKGFRNVLFVPEFLREGKALFDNLYPTRIVVGEKSPLGKKVAELFARSAIKENVEILLTNPTEAEAIKLFANTYLALRVAYFNELDTYSLEKGLNAKDIIRGIGLDPRIGTHYCNPSFGYGGYCLPKDTKQLLANYDGTPSALIPAIVKANEVRKNYIVDYVCKSRVSTVGIYRLIMKSGSDNFRSAAVFDIMKLLKDKGIEVVIYEPTVSEDRYNGFFVEKDFNVFKDKVELILANRLSNELQGCNKVFSRDVFGIE